ncbi:unnamed protein product [Mesocestoides corti]|uniref:RING-type domain-containing protein n=1 Tax=Mesocestoides corti TaxID=53468 RepID=A0A0R3UKH5_MESCO|nr:unnamed protein product [Mesocestoides corti]
MISKWLFLSQTSFILNTALRMSVSRLPFAKDMDERILECPICLEQFKVPTMLPCQHSFCQECILKYIHGKGRFCPVCSQTFQEPDMRKNLLLGQIIDSTNMVSPLFTFFVTC